MWLSRTINLIWYICIHNFGWFYVTFWVLKSLLRYRKIFLSKYLIFSAIHYLNATIFGVLGFLSKRKKSFFITCLAFPHIKWDIIYSLNHLVCLFILLLKMAYIDGSIRLIVSILPAQCSLKVVTSSPKCNNRKEVIYHVIKGKH